MYFSTQYINFFCISAYQLCLKQNKIGHQKEIYGKQNMTFILPVTGLLFLLDPKFSDDHMIPFLRSINLTCLM